MTDNSERAAAAAGPTEERRRRFGFWVALLAIFVAVLLLWRLHALLLMVFAAVLIAVLLDAAASGVRRVADIGQLPAVLLSIAVLLLLSGAGFALLGARTLSELSQLSTKLPEAVRAVEEWLGIGSGRIEEFLTGQARDAMDAGVLFRGLSGVTGVAVAAATGLVVALAGGVFLALDPVGYREGALQLIPAGARSRTAETLDAVGRALRAWLLGQLATMAVVGLATGLGLWALGVPTPIALGAIAGLLEFIPYVGPVASAVPAVAVAFLDGAGTALWVVVLFVAIQQIEGAVLMPLIQREAVNLPPPVTIFAVTGFGILFGVIGIVLATPLAVVAYVLVKRLWVPAMARMGDSAPDADPPARN